jgi:hypothetical protein
VRSNGLNEFTANDVKTQYARAASADDSVCIRNRCSAASVAAFFVAPAARTAAAAAAAAAEAST